MNQKELTKTYYNDFILKKPFGLNGLYNIISTSRVKSCYNYAVCDLFSEAYTIIQIVNI